MRVELSQLPAIDVAGGGGIPGRRTWDAFMTQEELAALARAAETLRERPEPLGLDPEALRALTAAVELAQMVVRREEEGG